MWGKLEITRIVGLKNTCKNVCKFNFEIMQNTFNEKTEFFFESKNGYLCLPLGQTFEPNEGQLLRREYLHPVPCILGQRTHTKPETKFKTIDSR